MQRITRRSEIFNYYNSIVKTYTTIYTTNNNWKHPLDEHPNQKLSLPNRHQSHHQTVYSKLLIKGYVEGLWIVHQGDGTLLMASFNTLSYLLTLYSFKEDLPLICLTTYQHLNLDEIQNHSQTFKTPNSFWCFLLVCH